MKLLIYIFISLSITIGYSQQIESDRIEQLKKQLDTIAIDNNGLTQQAKSEINVNNISLSNFLLALSEVHDLNINVTNDLNDISIKNNFPNAIVSDLLVFLCKEYDLTIDFTGSILSIKKYTPPIESPKKRAIDVQYLPQDNNISIDAKENALYDVFKIIMDRSGKNLVFKPGMENKLITSYIKSTSFEAAMDKLALANNLIVNKTKDNFYVFENNTSDGGTNSFQVRAQRPNFNYKILDSTSKVLRVNFVNTPIATIVEDIGGALNIDIFTAAPLEKAGLASLKAKSITFDELLIKIFEAQSNYNQLSNTSEIENNRGQSQRQNRQSQNPRESENNEIFTFKKEGNIYFFGTEKQLSVRQVELIRLKNRSVELLGDPSGNLRSNNNFSQINRGFNNSGNTFGNQNGVQRNAIQNQTQNSTANRNQSNESETREILDIIPDDIKQDLELKVDIELNSIYAVGTSTKINRFKQFLNQIDRKVPMVLIEVMIIEVNKTASIEAGVTFGLGEGAVQTQGGVFPETNLTLGAQTVNRIIGSFNSFGGFNLGRVATNFFATVRAMETNGDLKIRSTPKLATLNGHRANFSNGQTSSFTVTDRNIFGTDNPVVNEIENFIPIEAELGLNIKPSVTGDGQVILDINVIQSTFGARVSENGPPDIISRNFNSIIRMKDQDIAILGGLEEQRKSNSGSGVPFLAKIPIIKWLFSERRREASKSKLTILIKPTVIYQ